MPGSSKDRPIVSVVVASPSPESDEAVKGALSELVRFDPTVRVRVGDRAGHYVLEGRRVAQLEVICDRVREEYRHAIEVSEPAATLLETIRGSAVGEGKYLRQIGGQGNYGHCKVRVEPNEAGKGYQFINEVSAGQLPVEYVGAVESGVQKSILDENRQRHPLVDLKVTLIGGSYHEIDSNPMAFEFAGAMALGRAVDAAKKIILEPMMAIEVAVPELADLDQGIAREVAVLRGRVTRSKTENGWCEIEAIVLLSELLVSGSRTLANFPMEFAGYEQMRDDGGADESGTRVPVRPRTPREGRVSDEPL